MIFDTVQNRGAVDTDDLGNLEKGVNDEFSDVFSDEG